MITLLTLLKIIALLVAIASTIFIFFALWSIYTLLTTKVPWVKTPKKNIDIILDEINLPKNSIVYDLGCGDGRFLFRAEKQGHQVAGYELSLYPYLKCLARKKNSGSKAEIKKKIFRGGFIAC